MDVIYNQSITEPKFSEFFKVSMCQTNEKSIFYIAGMSILRIYVINKFIKGLTFDYLVNIKIKLSELYEYAKSLNEDATLSLYWSIITTLDNAANFSQAFTWLDAYISIEEYANIQKAIIITGGVIFNLLAIQNNIDLTQILSYEPVKVLSWLSEYLHSYIQVIWATDNYLYGLEIAETAPIVKIYYNSENNLFGILHHKSEVTQIEYTVESNPFIYYVEKPEDFNEAKPKVFHEPKPEDFNEAKPKVFHEAKPENFNEAKPTNDFRVHDSIKLELLNLVDKMAIVIFELQLCSEDMQAALNQAVSVQPQLKELKWIDKLLKLERAYCDKHYTNEVIKIEKCEKYHCRECMFEIFNLLTRENYKIYCPCGNRLPPVKIKEIKKTQDYLEFKQKI